MRVQPTPIPGLYRVCGAPVTDARGRFARVFCEAEFAEIRPHLHFTQVNFSETRDKGTIRGMHFQHPPVAEAKLIRCVRGCAFDVAVDLRAGSPTFLQWHAIELSADDADAVFIPEGIAHGFQALTDDTHLLYLHTAPWTPECEDGVRHDDPRLGILWPLPPEHLSPRDLGYPLLDGDYRGVTA